VSDILVNQLLRHILTNVFVTFRALVNQALRAYSNTDIYAPEKARALFLRSQILNRLKQTVEAEQDLAEALELYKRIVGVTLEQAVSPTKENFDELIAFWSR
jgi:uridine kinase